MVHRNVIALGIRTGRSLQVAGGCCLLSLIVQGLSQPSHFVHSSSSVIRSTAGPSSSASGPQHSGDDDNCEGCEAIPGPPDQASGPIGSITVTPLMHSGTCGQLPNSSFCDEVVSCSVNFLYTWSLSGQYSGAVCYKNLPGTPWACRTTTYSGSGFDQGWQVSYCGQVMEFKLSIGSLSAGILHVSTWAECTACQESE